MTEVLPSGWRSRPFWSLFFRQKRVGFPDEELLSVYRDYGVIRKDDRDDNHNRAGENPAAYQLVEPGDLVLNKMKTWQGSLGVSSLRGIVSPAYFVYRSRSRENEAFLHYALRSTHYIAEYASFSKGVRPNQWDLQPEYLDSMRVLLPPRDTQRAIADYLDRETGQIDAMIAKMDELAEILELRRAAAVDDEIIPHYAVGTVPLAFASAPENFFDGDWVESKDQDPNGSIRLLQLADVGAGEFLDKSNRRVNEKAFERLRCREIGAGDILIARMPDPLGRACVLPSGLGRTITVVDVAVLRPDPSKILAEYLVYVLNSPTFRSLLDSLQSGSTRQRISRSRLGQQRIPAPDTDTQRATISRLNEVTDKIDVMLAKVAELKSLLIERRAVLITDVVTGRKKVA